MADVLVVHFSRSGHCRALARALGEKHGWDLGEIQYLAGTPGYGRCARDALLRREPEIRYAGPNPSRFGVVVLVSPIWCWHLCPPMRRFVRSMHGKLGNVAVLSCMGGSGAPNAVAEVERLIHRPIVARLALRQDEVDAGRLEALEGFAEQVVRCAAERAGPTAARVAVAST